jgi:hypothetical protein
VLLAGLSAGALGTAAAAPVPPVTSETYLTNDTQIPGAGYYHAPFRSFFPLPYNHFDPARKMYFYGGQWGPAPHRSIVNLSTPTPEAARQAQAGRTDSIPRSGFGSTSRSHFIPS